MDHDHQAEEIRRAMAEMRRNLDANTEVVMNHAREMVDWRYHVRKYPSLTLAAAAAVGYLAVPAKRQPPMAVDAADRPLGPVTVKTARQSSLAQQLLGTAARLVISNGMPLLAREAMRLWQQRGGSTPEATVCSSVENPTSSPQS
jgi:hypothetical protein